MSKRKWLLILLLILLAFIVILPLPSFVRTQRFNWRLRKALTFPDEGYVVHHPSLTTAATITLKTNEQSSKSIVVCISIENRGDKTLEFMVAAAKLNPEVATYNSMGWSSVHMYEQVDLSNDPADPPWGVSFARETPLRLMDDAALERLKSILSEQILIKVVHDDGVELLSVKPTLVVLEQDLTEN